MKSNLFDKIMETAAIFILLAATIFVLVNWSTIPEQIPNHYNFKGEPDDYGGRGMLIFIMVTGWLIVLPMIILARFPNLWNTGVERTPANAAVINRITRDLLSVMDFSMAILFGYMMITPVLGIAMGRWFMPLFLVLIFGNIIVTLVRLLRNR